MKKAILILLVGLFWCNAGFADPLGIMQKKLDVNFDCEIIKSVYPEEVFERIPESLKYKKFGFKEYNHPEDDFMLIHLNYDNDKNYYAFPDSIATRWPSNEEGVEFYYMSYAFGVNRLIQYRTLYHGGEKFTLVSDLYKLDKKTSEKFNLKFSKANKLPDDGFVKVLLFLTKDFMDYAKKNKAEPLTLHYSCKPS